MSYKCRECGEVFEEPHRWVETHGFTHGPFEHWSACPYCDSCDYDDEYTVEREEELERELEEERRLEDEAEVEEGPVDQKACSAC